MNLKLTKVLGDVTGVTGLKILRAILAGERDPQVLAKLRDRRCKHTVAEIAIALDGRYRPEHLTELRSSLTLWEKYQEVIAEPGHGHCRAVADDAPADVVAAVAAEDTPARSQAARSDIQRARSVVLWDRRGPDGHRGHRRSACPDAGQRVGDGLQQMAHGQAIHQLAGLVSQLEEDGRQGQVESHAQGQGPGGAGLAVGGVEPAAQQELPGRLPAAAAFAVGAPKAITAAAHKLARIVYNLMRYGLA